MTETILLIKPCCSLESGPWNLVLGIWSLESGPGNSQQQSKKSFSRK